MGCYERCDPGSVGGCPVAGPHFGSEGFPPKAPTGETRRSHCVGFPIGVNKVFNINICCWIRAILRDFAGAAPRPMLYCGPNGFSLWFTALS